MFLSLVGVAIGLVVLTYAADQFVAGAARLAFAAKLSAIVVGAVVIGFGTSAPEMVVSALSARQGLLDIAVGNVIGSNVANLSLVLGAAALVCAIPVTRSVVRREAPLSLGSVLLFAVLVQGGISMIEGSVLLVTLAASLVWIIVNGRVQGDEGFTEEIDEFVDGDQPVRIPVEVGRTLLGLAFTVAAAQLLITSGTDIAGRIGLGEGFVGLTIVAIGTSLPELATSLQAARRRETDLIVGNLLGSNLFNSLAVGGIAGLVGPGPVEDPTLTGLATYLMVGVCTAAIVFLSVGADFKRWQGALLLTVYLVAIPFLA